MNREVNSRCTSFDNVRDVFRAEMISMHFLSIFVRFISADDADYSMEKKI